MDYHVVRVSEKIDQIASTYGLTIDEIKSINQHIRDWNHLIAGTRINLPPISNALSDEINDVEPFIEEYYPKIMSDYNNIVDKTEVVGNNPIEKNNEEEKVLPTTEEPKNKPQNQPHYQKPSAFYNGYYPLYPPYYPYYSPYMRRRRGSINHK